VQTAVVELLAKRRDRAIAIILGVKERECDRSLSPAVQAKLRKVILDQLNEFYDLALDLLRSLDRDDMVLNEFYLEKIAALHTDVGEMRRLLESMAS
jgi:hypothetical protein